MTARKSLLLFATNVLNSLFGLASTFAIARLMGPGPMGTVAYLLGLTALWSSFSDLGLSSGLSIVHRKATAEREDYGVCVGTFALIKLVFTSVLVAGIWFIPLFSRVVLNQEVFTSSDQRWSYYLLSGTYVFNGLAAISLLTFEARRESARVSSALIVSSFVTSVAKITVALLGLDVVALSAAYLVESLVKFIVAWLLFPGHPIKLPRRNLLVQYISYALPLAALTIINSLVDSLPKVTLQWFWNAAELGHYAGILGITAVMGHVPTSAMKLFFPKICEDVARGNREVVRQRFHVAERYLLMVMVPIVIGVIAFRRPIIRLLLGQEFLPAADPLVVLAFSSLLATYFRPYGNLIYAIGQQSKEVLATLVALLVLTVTIPILVPPALLGIPMLGLGKTGTALAIVAMQLAGGTVEVATCRRYAGVGLYRRFVRLIPAGLVMAAVLWIGERLVGPLTIWHGVILGPVSLAVYVGGLALIGEFGRAEADMFTRLIDPRRMLEYIRTELK